MPYNYYDLCLLDNVMSLQCSIAALIYRLHKTSGIIVSTSRCVFSELFLSVFTSRIGYVSIAMKSIYSGLQLVPSIADKQMFVKLPEPTPDVYRL